MKKILSVLMSMILCVCIAAPCAGGLQAGALNTVRLFYNFEAHTGTSVETQYRDYAAGESVDLSVKAYKEGWVFLGWCDDVNGTVPLESYVMGDEDTQLFAVFAKDITITFIDGDIENTQTRVLSTTLYNTDTEFEFDPPAQAEIEGWAPAGWATENSFSVVSSYSVRESVVYYGVYSRRITVSYDANGGTGAPEGSAYTVYYNSCGKYKDKGYFVNDSDPFKPVREGYIFRGWKIGGEGPSVSQNIYIHDDTVFYADWYELPSGMKDITVSFYYFDENMNTVLTQYVYTVSNGASVVVTPPEIPVISGWTFSNWSRPGLAEENL